MSDHLDALEQAVLAVLADREDPRQADLAVDRDLWRVFDELGFTSLTVPESLGGSGGELRDASIVVRAAASAPMPLAEATFLAGPALSAAGIAWPGGVVTAATAGGVVARKSASGWVLDGRVGRVPWLAGCDHVVLVVGHADGPVVAVVAADADGVHIGPGRNIAGEPRDDAVLTSVEPVCAAVAAPPHTPVWFEALGAAARSVQIAGAAERALSATLRHISERVQFGRPLVRFQVIQHQAARLAADVMTIRVASDAAVLALRDRSPQAPFLVAAAKAEASTLARHVAAVSHQLHGAIGFTREHLLGTLTSRLWSWREEHGNETVWWDRLAQSVDPPGHEVWEVITGVNSAQVVAS